jgi:hypothetical protein
VNDIDIDDDASEANKERLGWRTLRPPSPVALTFGAVYGAIAGAIVVWDIAVLIRAAKILGRRVSEERQKRRHRSE